MPKKTIFFSSLVFVLGLALLFFFLNREYFSTTQTTKTNSAEPSAAIAPRPECPETALPVSLPCLGADSVPNTSKAQYTVVSLWAWWCQPCRVELPLFDQLRNEHPEYNVIGVHADKVAAPGAQLLTDLNVELPSYHDDRGTFAAALGLPSVVPITIVFDERGTMLGYQAKAFTDYAELEQAVASLIAGAS
ncbi:TlpA family protein disulfide reductase [Corynebacterium sp. sy017]|uniref:TlpA family protein disulfide reductase n=1 Tax=unclassified Corynebacterium TaxID=2624378 RepID=UPI001185C458|nr:MULTISPECIES: TlpA disulfide reductase family protein [unclassified Corynebacterium]MBP3089397.1 TlpA family protein disulfide reductase [Corynebacterium sp. sy017]TSD90915.1 TlpA family protein disulfide reductase [Corynebacterium sp. SY003]